MPGDLSSTTFPSESAVPLHYEIGETALVGEALGRCDDLLSNLGEAPGNEPGLELLRLYQSFSVRARAVFFDRLMTRCSAVPLRDLFLRLNAAPGATAWLVRMREHLQHHKKWAPIERDLTDVLRSLFDRSRL